MEEGPREDTARRQLSAAQGKRLQRKPTEQHLQLGFLTSTAIRKLMLLFKPPSPWHSAMAALPD